MNKKPKWMVVYGEPYRVGGYYDSEEVVDSACVFTITPRRARVLAVRWWRRMQRLRRGRYDQVHNGSNPYARLTVTAVETKCAVCGRRWDVHTDQQVDQCDVLAGIRWEDANG